MFKRIGNLIRGFFGLFVSGLEKQNAEALLEVERENLRKQIAQYKSRSGRACRPLRAPHCPSQETRNRGAGTPRENDRTFASGQSRCGGSKRCPSSEAPPGGCGRPNPNPASTEHPSRVEFAAPKLR